MVLTLSAFIAVCSVFILKPMCQNKNAPFFTYLVLPFLIVYMLCFRVFNKVKSRSAHMKSHRPLDAEPKRPKLEKPYEKVERSDDRTHANAEYQNKLPSAQ